jgi:hypothetical protein
VLLKVIRLSNETSHPGGIKAVKARCTHDTMTELVRASVEDSPIVCLLCTVLLCLGYIEADVQDVS